MAFNGSGLFERLYNWITDRDADVKIRADRMDAEMDGFATGLSNCITKDGQTTITQNIPFNNKKITGLAAGTASTDAVNLSQARDKLSASRNYYVRTDGSDSNTGLANTAGAAYLTIQKAINTALNNVDGQGQAVAISVADGTYTGAVAIGYPMPGSGGILLSIIGNSSTNTIISTTSANAISVSGAAQVVLNNLKLVTATSGDCLSVSTAAQVLFSGLNFGACAGNHISINTYAMVNAYGSYSITGGAGAHIHMPTPSTFQAGSITITLSGTPAFSSYFIGMRGTGCYANFASATFSGSGTGADFVCHDGAFLDMDGKDFLFLPGNSAGSASSHGAINCSAITLAAGASITYPMTIGTLWMTDGVGGGAEIGYLSAVATPVIIYQNGATFVTGADPGAGTGKLWVQAGGLFTNRFVGTLTISIAPKAATVGGT